MPPSGPSLRVALASVQLLPVRAVELGSQPLTCKIVMEPLEGTFEFLRPLDTGAQRGEVTPKVTERCLHGQEEGAFPHGTCCTVSGSAGPPGPDVTLGRP